jgi:hypothetical protein
MGKRTISTLLGLLLAALLGIASGSPGVRGTRQTLECDSSVSVDLLLANGASRGKVVLLLYLVDRLMADGDASLVATRTTFMSQGTPGKNIIMSPDQGVVKMLSADMQDPEYYVAMDVPASNLTYAGGPAFGIPLCGGSALLEVTEKEVPEQLPRVDDPCKYSVPVDVSLADANNGAEGGQAVLLLYLVDRMDTVFGQSATLVATRSIKMNKNHPERNIVMRPAEGVVERLSAGMEQPEYYIALDVSESDVTYANEPDFGIGISICDGSAELVVKDKVTPCDDCDVDTCDKSVSVDVTLTGGSQGGTAVLVLYLVDADVADQSATRVATATTVMSESTPERNIILKPNEDQVADLSSDMSKPEYYVALDVSNSDVTYAENPSFGISICDGSAELLLKDK